MPSGAAGGIYRNMERSHYRRDVGGLRASRSVGRPSLVVIYLAALTFVSISG